MVLELQKAVLVTLGEVCSWGVGMVSIREPVMVSIRGSAMVSICVSGVSNVWDGVSGGFSRFEK